MGVIGGTPNVVKQKSIYEASYNKKPSILLGFVFLAI
jgi:hypothetical protein